jgi:hypothetical protein
LAAARDTIRMSAGSRAIDGDGRTGCSCDRNGGRCSNSRDERHQIVYPRLYRQPTISFPSVRIETGAATEGLSAWIWVLMKALAGGAAPCTAGSSGEPNSIHSTTSTRVRWPPSGRCVTARLRTGCSAASRGISPRSVLGELQPDSPLLYIAAGGFAPGFEATANASGHPVVLWSLHDLYGSAASGRPKKAAKA